jgi:hypothetical protein
MRTIAIVLASVGALALGACGSSGGSSNSSSNSSSTPASTSSGGGTASTTVASTGNKQADAAVQAAVDACKQSISAAPTLSDSVKADLNKLCEKAASGNVQDVKKISKEVCLKIVDGSGVPAGSAKDQADAACNAVAN